MQMLSKRILRTVLSTGCDLGFWVLSGLLVDLIEVSPRTVEAI